MHPPRRDPRPPHNNFKTKKRVQTRNFVRRLNFTQIRRTVTRRVPAMWCFALPPPPGTQRHRPRSADYSLRICARTSVRVSVRRIQFGSSARLTYNLFFSCHRRPTHAAHRLGCAPPPPFVNAEIAPTAAPWPSDRIKRRRSPSHPRGRRANRRLVP